MGKAKKAATKFVKGYAKVFTLGLSDKILDPKSPKAPSVPGIDAATIAGEGNVDERRKRLAAIRSGATQNSFAFLVNNTNSAKKTLLGG